MGNLGGLFGGWQQQKANLSNAYAQLNGNMWTTATANATTWYNTTVTMPASSVAVQLAPPPRERTNLDWLDERVNEMRVRL